jgi:cytochrome c6
MVFFLMSFFSEYTYMKTIISVVALTLIGFAGSTLAADADKGKDVFNANCATCHSGGKNAMAAGKTLSKADLETNKMNSASAIIELVTNGKSPMPAFGKLETINAADIENVAAYVLKKADAGW